MRDKKMEGARYRLSDVVVLRSGGPKMTIVDFLVKRVNASGHKDPDSPESFAGRYSCQWFEGTTVKSGNFDEEAIELAPIN